MRIHRDIRFTTLLGLVALVASPQARAAIVEVSVSERGGGPIPDQTVVLYPVTPDIQMDRLYFFNTRPAGHCTTGSSGRCQIGDLRPGVYVPNLASFADPNLAAPIGPPMVAYGTVTVSKPDARALLRIELQRGVRIFFKVVSEGAALPPRSRIELHNESGESTNTELDAGGNAKITLGSGRWIAHLAGPQGAQIVAVELDGEGLTTLDVPIELVASSSDRFVTWTLNRPCIVEGKVTTTRKPPASSAVMVTATLVTPGSWSASPLCRATDCAGKPSSPVSLQGNYAIYVPSGTWRIAPAGPSLLESNPPYVELTCGEGERVRADFDVRETEPGTESGVLVVHVVGPDGKPVPEVPVEAWPPTGNLETAAPLAVEATGRFWQPAVFKSLAAGSYLLRARRAGYRNAVLAVPDLDAKATAPRSVTMTLEKGATIDALVRDEKDQPVTGVGLEVRRVDVGSRTADPAARLAESDAEISVPPSNDQTGHVVVSGLAGGTYSVTPVLSGAIATAAVASVAALDGPAEPEVVVTLGEQEVKELNVRVLPAPSLTGRLVCEDDGLFPRQADVCVLGLPPADEDDAVREACEKPVISPGAIALSGDRGDVFRVGPLKEGNYRLGLRPRGYARWTWMLGTPDGAQAAMLQVAGTEAIDLGTITMHCGPAVALLPTVLSHDPAPTLMLARVDAELTRKAADGKVERRVLAAEKDRDRVMLRELPEGEWTLDVTMSHPFFVPAVPIHLTVPVKLERGGLVRASIEIVSVGGAVVFEAPSGAARLTGPEGVPRVTAAKDGRIAIDGVAPGSYDVEVCEDSACARVIRRWDAVQVARGRQLVLATTSR
jgi:hypothetical protein